MIRVERMWSGGEVSLNGSHVTLPKVTELKLLDPVETWLFHRIVGLKQKYSAFKPVADEI